MNNAFNITLVGGNELAARLEKASDIIKTEVIQKVQDGGDAIAAEASQRAPVRYGFLSNMITSRPIETGAEITSAATYSAYVEFGTGTKVSVPADLQEFAIQFKGTKRIHGQRAQPFFFPAANRIAPIIIADIQKTLDKL